MKRNTYNMITLACTIAAVISVVIFDQFEGSRAITAALGGGAGVLSTGVYFLNRRRRAETALARLHGFGDTACHREG
jgi:hypothetical protein